MAEYIEREPLIKVLKKWCDDAAMGDNECAYSLADDLLHEVNAQPAIDIERPTKSQFKRMAAQLGYEPVVYARWEAVAESQITGWEPAFAGRDPIGGYFCTNCHYEAIFDCNDEYVLSARCPNCSARMEGGANNG